MQVTFDETSPKLVEVDIVDYACILEKTFLHDEDQYQDHDKDQNQSQTEDHLSKYSNIDIKILLKNGQWRTARNHWI